MHSRFLTSSLDVVLLNRLRSRYSRYSFDPYGHPFVLGEHLGSGRLEEPSNPNSLQVCTGE